MKKIVKKEGILKEAGICLVVLVLLFSNQSLIANKIDMLTQSIQTDEELLNGPSESSLLSLGKETGEERFFLEDMEEEDLPPTTPPWGEWKNTTISGQSWYIDDTVPDPPLGKYCATVCRGNYDGIMDEWLITPNLDFSKYSKGIKLRFSFYTSHYAAQKINLMDLNVSITTNNEVNWTFLWNENNIGDFWSFKWNECEIDLKNYSGESTVKIGFQFRSWNKSLPDIQEYSIDTVKILGEVDTDFWCDNGPDEIVSWSHNNIVGIQFIGDAGGGTPPYKNWTWSFGDDSDKRNGKNPKYNYQKIGTYNVTLEVEDSANPPHIARSNKTVEVVETQPSEILLKIKYPSLGIKIEFKNTGNLNITQIDWEITIQWGLIKKHKEIIDEGNISFLEGGTKKTIRSPLSLLFLIWQGPLKIVVTAQPLNSVWAETVAMALKIGPGIFLVRELD